MIYGYHGGLSAGAQAGVQPYRQPAVRGVAFILQPGPAALSDGLEQMARIIGAVARGEKLAAPRDGAMRSAI